MTKTSQTPPVTPFKWRKIPFVPVGSHGDHWESNVDGIGIRFEIHQTMNRKEPYAAELYSKRKPLFEFADEDGWVAYGDTPKRALSNLWRKFENESKRLQEEARRMSNLAALARITFKFGPTKPGE